MKTKLPSTFLMRRYACALMAALTSFTFTPAPEAVAQTGPGYALSFNATNTFVAVASTYTVPYGTDPYTIEAWIKPNSMGDYGIIGWGDYGVTNALNALSLRPNGLVNSWWGNELAYTNTGLAGAWHHVAVTCNGTSWRIIYLDGVLVRSNSFSGTHIVPLPASLTIGRVGPSNYFNGAIDEVRVWNQARTQLQIQTNRFTHLTGSETGLKAYWKCDEGAGSTTDDSALSGLSDGTLNNSPAWIRSGATNAPEGVTTIATAITTASARLNAKVHPGNLAAKAWFQWGTTVNYGTNTPQITVGPGLPADPDSLAFDVSSVLTNLTCNTTYYYRVAITNTAGTNYGAQGSVTTLPLPTGPGCALTFDGTNDYVQAGSVPLANASFTLEAWVRRLSTNTPDFIVSQGGIGSSAGLHFGFHYAPEYGRINEFVFGFYNDDLWTTNRYTDDDWHHWAATYNAATKARCIYRDGSLVASNVAAANYQGAGPLVIGDVAWGGAPIHGTIDEVRIWGAVRSEAQLQANLYRPLAGNETGLLAYWKFDECSDTFAADTTGHGFDGTLVNGPTWSSSTVHFGPGIATLPATNLTTTAAMLKGTAHPQGFATTAWFQWGTTTNYGNTTIVTNTGSGTTVVALSTNITGLASFQTYHFRAVAANSYGTSYGENQSFWFGPPIVATQPASNLTTNAATLNSSVTPSGPSTYAWFQWGLTTSYGSTTTPVAIGSSTIPLSVTNRLSSLLAGSTYHFRIAASNSFGGPTYGNDLTFTTPVFGAINSGLPLAGASSVAWGDYDNDGDLDVLVGGWVEAVGDAVARIYRNNNNGTFTQMGISLEAVQYPAVAWGDYDNDGDLDLLVTGWGSVAWAPISYVYRNNGNSTFTYVNMGLAGVWQSAVAWGDYDNDGDLDLLLTGQSASAPVSRIYRNNGNSTFTDLGAGLPGVYTGSVAWGDYDNDGDLDLLLTGYSWDYGRISRVYRNNGNSTFTDLNLGLPGVESSSVAWADYDNDGNLDFVLTGGPSSGPITRIYHNNGNSTFTNLGADLPGVYQSALAWADYDNDGWVDLLLTGSTGAEAISRLYHNNGNGTFTHVAATILPGLANASVALGDHNNDGRVDILLSLFGLYQNYWPITNRPPTAPMNLIATVTGTNATLFWSVPSDQQTPGPGLSYNLRVGTAPGGSSVVSAQAAANGYRRLPQLGNTQPNFFATLNGLKYGSNYYWSVQAVDSAYAGSPFANEVTFTVTLAPSACSAQVGNVVGNAVEITAAVYPNGTPTTACIQWGANASYGNSTTTTNLGSGPGPMSLSQMLTGLQPDTLYHYRIVTSNANGTSYGADQTFYVGHTSAVGDVNGDGVVDQGELDAVLASYWPTSPWLFMTNAAGLGGTNVTFALTNSTAGGYSVEFTTNLAAWQYLGPATPRYEFTDTNAPAQPQRYYRLRWP